MIRDGDPGEPDVTLSPVSYLYTHRIPVEIAAFESATLTREQVLDDMLAAIGAAIIANRRLGGLVDWIDAKAPTSEDIETAGSQAGRFADVVIVATYATADPLN